MSRYKQLSDAYALNTQALIAYRTEARDALNTIREAVRKHLGLIVAGSDIVRVTSDGGGELFSTLALLDHGDSINFELAVTLGGEAGLPKSNVVLPAALSGRSGAIVLAIPSINLEQALSSEESYQAVAEAVFGGIIRKLEKF